MDLESYLKQNKIWYRFIEKAETIHTADAAKAAGIELSLVTKNLVSKTDLGEYVLLIVPGDRKVDLEKVARILNVKKVRLVPFDQASEISGYLPGATPSIGHKVRMKTILDRALTKHDTIYCGGGSRDRLLELKTNDIITLSGAIVDDITVNPQ
ncbi:MAG: YbaK/EbsC family protein [Nitrososphaeria archaeon]